MQDQLEQLRENERKENRVHGRSEENKEKHEEDTKDAQKAVDQIGALQLDSEDGKLMVVSIMSDAMGVKRRKGQAHRLGEEGYT